MHKSGNKYVIAGAVFILATFILEYQDYGVLISLDDGNRWVAPVPVKDLLHITDEEFNKIRSDGHAVLANVRIEIKNT